MHAAHAVQHRLEEAEPSARGSAQDECLRARGRRAHHEAGAEALTQLLDDGRDKRGRNQVGEELLVSRENDVGVSDCLPEVVTVARALECSIVDEEQHNSAEASEALDVHRNCGGDGHAYGGGEGDLAPRQAEDGTARKYGTTRSEPDERDTW